MIYRLRPCDGEAVYSTDDLYIRFTCRMVVDHYGAPNSPTWLVADEEAIEIIEIEAEGITLDPRRIPQGERDRFFTYDDNLTFKPVEEEEA